MNTLVTGTFEDEQHAAQAVRKLVKSCVPVDLVRTIPARKGKRHPADRKRSQQAVRVAVRTVEYVVQQLAIRILRGFGAQDIECVRSERRAKAAMRTPASVRKQREPAPAW